MNTISREELKAALDAGQDIKLVMMLSDFDYRMLHIPGSLRFNTIEDLTTSVRPGDDIVIYGTDETCPAGRSSYYALKAFGFPSVRLYEGGISDWEAAGYTVEGEMVELELA